jgi:acetoin utilization protein AcuC
VLTGGGGYELVHVVPRTWTHLLAEASGRPLDPVALTPESWREFARARTGVRPPQTMTDGAEASFSPFSSGYDPAAAVDRAIMATRNAVFPLHGLLPSP